MGLNVISDNRKYSLIIFNLCFLLLGVIKRSDMEQIKQTTVTPMGASRSARLELPLRSFVLRFKSSVVTEMDVELAKTLNCLFFRCVSRLISTLF